MKCEICNIELKRIGHHIQKIHNLTLQQYYDTYLKKENEDICPECGKKKKFNRDLSEAYNEFCGPSCAVKNKKIQEKMRDTCKKNFGVENILMLDDVKESGMMKKYGVINPLHSDELKEKFKQTCIDRYGVDHPSKIEDIKKKKIDTQILHFGDLYCRTPEARQSYRENFIHNIESQGSEYQVQMGKNEKLILDELEAITGRKIQRNFTCIGYYPDGYLEDLNLIIEVYESHHNSTCYIEHDERREKELTAHLKCKFFIIKDTDWFVNKEQVINDFKTVLELITKE